MTGLAGQLPHKLLLIHPVLESFSPVDEDNWNFVAELPAEVQVHVDINLAPGKAAAAREFRKALFHDFTQVASFPGINDDTAEIWHAGLILAPRNTHFQTKQDHVARAPTPALSGRGVRSTSKHPRQQALG